MQFLLRDNFEPAHEWWPPNKAVNSAMEVQDVQAKKKLHCLGINSNLILRWKQELEAEGSNAFLGNGNRSPMEEELHRLHAENKRLLMELDILKKQRPSLPRRGSDFHMDF